MNRARRDSIRRKSVNAVWIASLFLLAGFSVSTYAEDYLNLPAVKPVMSCDQLGKAELSAAVGAATTIQSAVVVETAKGQFCRVTGNVDPKTIFEVDLPLEHWTQRFLENSVNFVSPIYAGSCAPAVNGDFAVAYSNQGHSLGGMSDASWTPDMQLRIDFAYRAMHVTALAAKALIRTFYGRPPRFSYFSGCSEGGREALIEAQRYPEDFDGISAGSPTILDSAHNAFFSSWESYANQRADGSRILSRSRLGILHAAILEHCAGVSGVLDGVLQEPTACRFDPAWVQCKAGSVDTSKCLTAEEAGVVAKLYQGPGDGAGHCFDISGLVMGSENQWRLSTAKPDPSRKSQKGNQLRRLLPPPEGDKSITELEEEFDYTMDWYRKTLALAPLNNGANTNLRQFEKHGGKLIIWNGAEDISVQPAVPIAYYQGVQKLLGDKLTDTFLRFFLIPGFGHCEGGDIPFQFDSLTPLMAWTELHRAPAKLIVGKTASSPSGHAAFGDPGGQAWPGGTGQAALQPSGSQEPPSGLAAPNGPWVAHNPLASPNQPTLFTRPVYPFPYIARYSGKGDPNSAESYEAVKSSVTLPQIFDTEAAKLYGPDNQNFYHVENGQLEPDRK